MHPWRVCAIFIAVAIFIGVGQTRQRKHKFKTARKKISGAIENIITDLRSQIFTLPSPTNEIAPTSTPLPTNLLTLSNVIENIVKTPSCYADAGILVSEINGYFIRAREGDPTLWLDMKFVCGMACSLQTLGLGAQLTQLYQAVNIVLPLLGTAGVTIRACVEQISDQESACSKVKKVNKCFNQSFDDNFMKILKTFTLNLI